MFPSMCVYACRDTVSITLDRSRERSGHNGNDSRAGARREQIKRDLQRAHDLVLLTLDVLMHSMKYGGT